VEQHPDLVESQSCILREPDHPELVDHEVRVPPAAGDSFGRRQDTDVLVIPDRGRADTSLRSNLAYGQCHAVPVP
jgi:hypothetical protein